MAMPNLPIKTGHLFIGIAVLMGLLTLFMFGGQKSTPTTASKTEVAKIETVSVVVPLVPIPKGKKLTSNDVTSVKWPSDFIPKGNLYSETTQVLGRVAMQDLFPGEPVFIEKLSGSNTGGGLPAIIPQGLRAVTIAVTEIKGVAGFVKPGDRVDVITTFEIPDSDGNGNEKSHATKTVVQNALVLASAQTMVDDHHYDIETPNGVTKGEVTVQNKTGDTKDAAKDAAAKVDLNSPEEKAKQESADKKEDEKAPTIVSSVTLALSPSQSEAVALAEQVGDLRLSLRSETDHVLSNGHGLTLNQLLGSLKPHIRKESSNDAPPPAALPAAPLSETPPPTVFGGSGNQVEFIQGTEKSTYSF